MNFLKFIKHIFLFLLTFLLGAQTTYAKTELVLPQSQIYFSIEKTQSFQSLEKEVQPNIGFLFRKFSEEKSKFGTAQLNTAVKPYNFSEEHLHYLAEGVDELLSAFKSGFSKESILAIPKGSRPNNPSNYLYESYINSHLSKFEYDDIVRVTNQSSINTYGGTLGGTDAFVTTKTDFELMWLETGGDLLAIESKLGFQPNSLGEDVVFAVIKREDVGTFKMPNGNEIGVNSNWLPGGVTSGGMPEAKLDLTTVTEFTPFNP